MLFVSSYSQYVEPNDVVAYEKSTVLGLIKTIPQEMPNLRCCHLDSPAESFEQVGNYILRRLCVLSKVPSLAYRGDRCLIPILEQANLAQQPKQDLPWTPGGLYLISGGLGGISVEVSRYLLTHYESKLILIGRSPLPERSTWDEHIKNNDPLAAKLKAYQTLERLGGQIVYEALDVCDRDRLQALVHQYESKWETPLRGVIHLAGVYQEQLLNRETGETLLAIIKPKLFGAWALQTLIADHPEAIFVTFSSAAGCFGGPMVGGYAAANSFMESFSEFQNGKKSGRHYCFAWSVWDGVGMSHGYQRTERIRASGYYTIPPVQGIHSLMAGLSRYSAPLLIGLDGGKQPIRRFIAKSEPLNQLTAYVRMQVSGQDQAPTLPVRSIPDRFGNPSYCQLLYASDEPLRHVIGLKIKEEIVEPRNETERILVEQWQKQLGKSDISIYDNYFELGGTSILAVQLMYQLQDILAMELPINLLLSEPTIEQIAQAIEDVKRGERKSFDMGTMELSQDEEDMRRRKVEENIQEEVDGLSNEALEQALADEISELEDLLENF